MTELSIIKRLYAEAKPSKIPLWTSVALYIPLTLLGIFQPLVVGQVASMAVLQEGFIHVTRWSAIFFVVVIVHAAIEALQLYMMQYVGQRLVYRMRNKLFRHIQALPISFFDTHPLGVILTRIINNVDAVSELFLSGSVQIIGDFLFIIATLVMLLIVDIKLSLLSFALLPILAIGVFYFRRWTRTALLEVSRLLTTLNSFLQERLTGILTLQAFAQVGSTQDAFEIANDELMSANKKAIFLDAAIYAFVDAIAYCSIAIVLLSAFELREAGALQLGILVAFVEALNRFFQPVRELSSRFAAFQGALVGAQRVFSFLDEDVVPSGQPQAVLPARFEHTIAFEHVNFTYPSGAQVLFDVNMTIHKGQHIALVGATGAGKSSIIKLLTRLYTPQSGSIYIDGINIQDMDPVAYGHLVKIVPQEVFLFEGTLRDNLRYGAPNASDEAIIAALTICQAGNILQRSLGLEQPVERGGLNFSLGERQLLALARAFLAQPDILVLDEATANVDPQTERRLQKATQEVLRGRTAIIVAHRLSTVETCDRILVFHQGHLLEEGNHTTLMQHNGLYHSWVQLHEIG